LIVRAAVDNIVGEPPVGLLKGVEERKKDVKARGRQEVKFEA